VVRPSVDTYSASRDISVLCGGISMRPATNIRHVNGNCWKGFQGQKSKVKVICVQMPEFYNGGDIHVNGFASRLTNFSTGDPICKKQPARGSRIPAPANFNY